MSEVLCNYPNVKELFWDKCRHPYTLVLPMSEDASLKPRVTMRLHGLPMIRCYDTDNDERSLMVRNQEPPTASIHPDYSTIMEELPHNWEMEIVEDPPEEWESNAPSFRLLAMTASQYDTLAQHAAVEVISRIDDGELRELLNTRSLTPGAKSLVRFAAATNVYKESPVELGPLHSDTLKELHLVNGASGVRPMSGFQNHGLDLHAFLMSASHGRPSAFSASDILEIDLTHPALSPIAWNISHDALQHLLGLSFSSTSQSVTAPLSPLPTPAAALHPDMPRGQMSELVIHLIMPFVLRELSNVEEGAVASRLADLMVPDETMTRALLHIGGPKCRYLLDADLMAGGGARARVKTFISERLMQSFNEHRRRIEGSEEAHLPRPDDVKTRGLDQGAEVKGKGKDCDNASGLEDSSARIDRLNGGVGNEDMEKSDDGRAGAGSRDRKRKRE